MTTLTTPAQPGQDKSVRPVPWRRLGWVSWRQYRFSVVGAAVFLGVLAAYLLIMGLRVRSGYASVASCRNWGAAFRIPAGSR
jgi:hypothetical protein